MDRWSHNIRARWPQWGPLVFAALLVGIWLLIPGIGTQAQSFSTESPSNAHRPNLAPAVDELVVTKSQGGDFRIDGTVFYTISVRSRSAVTITDPITVNDPFPTGLLNPQAPANPNWELIDQTGGFTWVFTPTTAVVSGTLLPEITFSGIITEAAAPEIENTVIVTYTLGTAEEEATDTITATVESADLELTMTHSPAAPAEGQQVVYTLNLKNNGPSTATAISVLDKLPTSLTNVTGTTALGSYNPTTGIWTTGPLAPQATATLQINATVATGQRGSTITNIATIQAATPYDYDTTNNSDEIAFTVATTQLAGVVYYDKNTNTTISGASVTVLDSQDNDYTVQTNQQGQYSFQDTTTTPLAPGLARITASHPNYYTNTVTTTLVLGQETERDIPLQTSDLQVTITDNRTTVNANETLNYNVNITNIGTYTATNIVFTSTINDLLNYSSITTGDAVVTPTVTTNRVHVWELADDLAPNAAFQATIVARVDASLPSGTNTITHTIDTLSESREAVLTNNTATDTNTNTTTGTATLTVSKDASPATVRQNQNITFNIEIRNTGNLAATNVNLTDQLPNLLSLVSAQSTQGNPVANTSTRTASVSIGTINPNATVRVTVIGRVRTSVSANTTQTNVANVSYRSGTTDRTASDSINFTVAPTSSLPNTGGRERPALYAAAEDPGPYQGLSWMAIGIALLLGGLGIGALIFGLRNQTQDPAWAGWYRKTGALLAVVALVFAAVGGGLWVRGNRLLTPSDAQPAANLRGPVYTATAVPTFYPAAIQPTIRPPQPTPTLIETLPDYPVPTPTIPATMSAQEQEPDTSSVNRIMVPDLGLDTVVKYVPYEETTWKIAGLREEVAWLGDTSWPGLGSNTALAAHVSLIDGSDGPFRYLHELGPGALIRIYTERNVYVYRLVDKRVVSDGDLSVVAPSDQPRLTLITCTGWDEELERYLQRIVLISELQEITPLNQQASLK